MYPDQCTGGFSDLVSPEGIGQGYPNNVATRLFPDLRFGCSGKIVRFTVAVLNIKGQQSPRIQIRRPNHTQPDIYYKLGLDIPIVDKSDVTVCLRKRTDDQVFRCILNEEFQVSVQPGDILGLELPLENDVNF